MELLVCFSGVILMQLLSVRKRFQTSRQYSLQANTFGHVFLTLSAQGYTKRAFNSAICIFYLLIKAASISP
jgi:hypothetical protein